MIRTGVVNLTVIPAVAYRQKLGSNGSGIMILRYDVKQPGIASISKTSGEPIPSVNTPLDKYPLEAFQEAITLTAGMPYRKLEGVKVTKKMVTPVKDTEPEPEEASIVDSPEYKKIVETYTDKNGVLSYDLLNKDLIKFGHSSSKVRAMVEEGASPAAIRKYIVGTKFRMITDNYDLTDKQIDRISALLDEVSPKGVYKELNAEIRRWTSKNKSAKRK